MSDRKPKVALVVSEMSVGGIPRASIPLMKQMSKLADITLVLTNDKGVFQSEISEGVKTEIIPYQRTKTVMYKLWQEKRYGRLFKFLIATAYYGHITGRWVKNNAIIASYLGHILEEEFDCAISYHGMNIDHLTRTLFCIKAKKKVAWIHGDHPFKGIHKKDAAELYSLFDKIYVDSEMYRQKFIVDFPETAFTSEPLHCLLDMEEVRRKAAEDMSFTFEKNNVNILTVGRLSPEKGQDMIVETLKILDRKNLRWYLVGDGPDKFRIEMMMRENNCGQLVLLGAKTNPYPYIKGCDIYVQPSYSECYSLTAVEAATLEKPIVITNVVGATEVFKEDEDAVVVESNSRSIAQGIARLIDDGNFRNRLISNLQGRDFSNYDEVERIIDWVNKE